MMKRNHAIGESGQAITEYMLVVAVVVGFFTILVSFLNSYGLTQKLAAPITQNFARTYEYGKATAYGFEDGGPKDHPRIYAPGNFRIFINPSKQ